MTNETSTPSPSLASPEKLERICRGLATLDAILSEEWDYRSYSFNSVWSPDTRLASMRDGGGDEWFLAFARDGGGAFLKAGWHGAPPAESAYEGIAAALQRYTTEPAFSGSTTTFGGWFDGTSWTLRGQVGAFAGELAVLTGDPEVYRTYAEDYFETELPLEAIAHVLAGKPIDAALLAELGSNRTLEGMAADLKEIGY